jgi:protein gp37
MLIFSFDACERSPLFGEDCILQALISFLVCRMGTSPPYFSFRVCMVNPTKIDYLDKTWNPQVGCSGVNCAVSRDCWARGQAKRRKHDCPDCYTFKPHLHLERMNQPLSLKTPSKIGVNFMGDTFDDLISNSFEGLSYWGSLLSVIEKASWHRFMLFTKQPQNIPDCLSFPKNLIVCVSVNRLKDLWRVAALKKSKAVLKGISAEPLLEDIAQAIDFKGIDWLTIGAQTRPDFQPQKEWVVSLVDRAICSGVPVFLKRNLVDWQNWLQYKLYPKGWS